MSAETKAMHILTTYWPTPDGAVYACSCGEEFLHEEEGPEHALAALRARVVELRASRREIRLEVCTEIVDLLNQNPLIREALKTLRSAPSAMRAQEGK